jgi:GT2 family glycosyltransferase
MNSTSNLPLISIVIPNYNGARYLEACLCSLLAQTWQNMEIILVDNASIDDSIRITRDVAPAAVVLQQKSNLGYAGGANAGMRAARGEWVAVINNDAEAAPDWLAECAAMIQKKPEASFLACRILEYSDRAKVFSAGDCFLRSGIGYRRGQEQSDRKSFRNECEIFSASGCAALYKKSALDELGGFDDRFFAYLEDVDLGLRLQAFGHSGFYVPGAEVYHHGGGTSGGEFSKLSVRLRTRNSLLLLIKSLPASIILRSIPMIAACQASWILRVMKKKRLWSYAQGLAGAFALAPEMLKERAAMRGAWKSGGKRLWQQILDSELLASEDFRENRSECTSTYLRWHFTVFTSRTRNRLQQ